MSITSTTFPENTSLQIHSQDHASLVRLFNTERFCCAPSLLKYKKRHFTMWVDWEGYFEVQCTKTKERSNRRGLRSGVSCLPLTRAFASIQDYRKDFKSLICRHKGGRQCCSCIKNFSMVIAGLSLSEAKIKAVCCHWCCLMKGLTSGSVTSVQLIGDTIMLNLGIQKQYFY